MRTNNITAKGFLAAGLLSTILAFSACSADTDNNFSSSNIIAKEETVKEETATEEDKVEDATFSLTIKAISQDNDITTKGKLNNVTLFVFDENNEFNQQIEVDKSTILMRKKIQIRAREAKSITVIAWGGLTNNKEEVSSLDQTNIISDLHVQLKQNNGQVANSPSDLFYGQIKLSRDNQTRTNDIQTLVVERKVSLLSLSTKNVVKKFNTTDGDYYYKVKGVQSTIDFNGDVTGNESEYIIPAYVNANGHLSTTSINVLPSDDVVVELYRDDILVFSSENFENSENLSLTSGEQLNISFDANKSKFDTLVVNFDTVVQNVTIG